MMFSHENRSLPDLMMGLEIFIPPFVMDAAAPTGARGGLNYRISWKPYLPRPCPARGPETGSAHIHCKYFTDFHDFGVNRLGSCPVLQSNILQSAMTFPNDSL